MSYTKTAFWPFLEYLGLDNLTGEILARKLQLVYVDWPGILVFVVLLVASIRSLASRRNRPSKPLSVREWMSLTLCAVIGGVIFFSTPFLSHAMAGWPLHLYFVSMLWSLAVAVAPVALLYFQRHKKEERKQYRVYFLALVPLMHSAMAVVYLLNPLTAFQ